MEKRATGPEFATKLGQCNFFYLARSIWSSRTERARVDKEEQLRDYLTFWLRDGQGYIPGDVEEPLALIP